MPILALLTNLKPLSIKIEMSETTIFKLDYQKNKILSLLVNFIFLFHFLRQLHLIKNEKNFISK